MNVNNRLDRLERQARKSRHLLVACLIAMAMVAASGFATYLDDDGASIHPASYRVQS
ncbi:hypothetical protein [Cupriavidus basilensis]|uniref:hypothetical protein n=1 Tax=Cupriavidus basilensis TaxID=68895 RepID=UPI0020A69E2E|nr:hypothetical protein [Cupriavidus basilensis]MCP3018001.1 hypothetical protein [Cupriavidus basilensis]